MASRARENARKKDFKKAIDPDEARKKREDAAVQLRKSKRVDQVMKRRMFTVSGAASSTGDQQGVGSRTNSVAQLPDIVAGLRSTGAAERLQSTVRIRELLSVENNPPVDEVVNAGVVPLLVDLLSRSPDSKQQFEAAWALTNIAAGSTTQTQHVIESGAVAVFVKLLSSENEEIREQAVWALGNIAGDGPATRNFVLDSGAMEPLLVRLFEATSTYMVRNATWTLSNLCRGNPPPPFSQVRNAVPMLASLARSDEEDVVADACLALSYVSDGGEEQIQELIDANIVRKLVELIADGRKSIQLPALRTIGNIVTGSDQQTNMVIRFDAVPHLHALLSSGKKSVRKDACWAISNIAAGSAEQIQALLDDDLAPSLIYLAKFSDYEVRKEAAWAISNITFGGTGPQVKFLVECGCIEPLCTLLEDSDARLIDGLLDGLDRLLKVGERERVDDVNPICVYIEESGGLDKLEQLQHHENEAIYAKAASLIKRYFDAHEQTAAEVVPASTGTAFQFGTANAGASGQRFNFDGDENMKS